MDDVSKASTILTMLETYNFVDIDNLYSDYLQPFTPFISPNSRNPNPNPNPNYNPNPNPNPNPNYNPNPNPKTKPWNRKLPPIRSLVKTFLPFISKSLSLIPKRLSESPKHPKTLEFISPLLDSYRLCLDCLESASCELSGKPYGVYLQRVRFIHCLLRWERYLEGIEEGFRVLNGLGRVGFDDGRVRVSMGKLVPCLVDWDCNEGKIDGDFVRLIVDVVVAIAQCVSLSKCTDVMEYTRLLVLVDEVKLWFRYLDSDISNKLQWKLLTYMRSITVFLVREVQHFEGDIVPEFFAATFSEHTTFLNSQCHQGRVGEEMEEFIKFVSNSAYKCRSLCIDLRSAVAMRLHKLAGGFSQGLAKFSVISRLYATGLHLSELNLHLNACCSPDMEVSICSSSSFLPEVWDKLQHLSALLTSAKSCHYSDLGDYRKPLSSGGFVGMPSAWVKVEDKKSEVVASINAEKHLSFYVDALNFVCSPLAEFVNSARKKIISGVMDNVLRNGLKLIQEVMIEYCYLFPHSRKEKDPCEELDGISLTITGAAFTLSLRLNLDLKASKGLYNYLLSDKCIESLQPQRIKHIVATLHNTFVEFYKEKQLKEASKAIKLCCRASWCRCLFLCKTVAEKSKGFDGELSDAMIAESLNEACKLTSLYVDILRQIDNDKIKKVMVYSMEKWCVGRSHFERFPCPEALVKQWVKIQLKSYRNTDVSASILGYMLLHSSTLTKHNLSSEVVPIILEQELLAYQELSNLFPKFSQKMQIEIIDILLLKVYDTDKFLQRSKNLVKKGMLLRAARGSESLESCICCYSEAIESIERNMSSFHGFTHEEAAASCCQLAVAYSLRAQCNQEADSKSKELFNDLRKAVSLLSRIDISACSHSQSDIGLENMLSLLFHTADLLSVKGNIKLHSDVVNVIIKVIKWMNISSEKCLALLWGSRRLCHALCIVPINEAFITFLSDCYGKEVESLDFWMCSMKDSQPLSIGLEQSFSFLFSTFPMMAFRQCNHSLRTEIPVDEVKEVARQLISNGPMKYCSAFLAGYLYYDLSERLSARGFMIEALSCAKEAHRLRGKLLQQHFSFSFEQCEEKNDESDRAVPRQSVTISYFTVLNQVTTKAWSNSANSLDLDSFVPTPWIVLQCYLESTLQVGIVHETLGNGAEAEAQFRLGKSISCLQNLPLFSIIFSTCLGKVYIGKSLLDLARKELLNAEQVFADERNSITCSRCTLMLKSSIHEQLGSLYRRGVQCASENPYELSLKRLICLETGDLAIWLEQAHFGAHNVSKAEKTKTKTEARKPRKAKKASEQLTAEVSNVVGNSRVTRSRKQSQNKSVTFVDGVQNAANLNSGGKLEREASNVSNKVICQKCFSNELKNLSSLTCHIQMMWEFVRRRQILRLLIGLGKCQNTSAGIHKLHIYSKCVSILMGGNDCNCKSFPIVEFDMIVKEISGHVMAVERAEVFYFLCWFSLTCLYSKDTRRIHCNVCCIQLSQVVQFLKLSFVLSREVPLLFQKVSRLLAVIYVVSSVRGNSQLVSSSCNVLSANFWASYFHQASVGVHQNVRFLSLKHNSVKGFEAPDYIDVTPDICTLLRMAPDSIEDIEAYVANFFENLPISTIVCMSLLGISYASLIAELMDCPSVVHGWILLSNLNADDQPAVVLLPLSSVIKDNADEEMSFKDSVFAEKNVLKEWCSPWGCTTVVDDVAPLFNSILRGNYVSCSSFSEEETDKNREMWWTRRAKLDKGLQKLLRDMEESWFGPWKYLLLGRLSECGPLRSAVKELMHEIEARRNLVVNESIIKVILGGICLSDEKERIPWMFLEEGCYIGKDEDCDGQMCDSLDETCKEDGYVSGSLIELMHDSVKKLEAEYCTRREPVVLVLDSDIQMVPWENMPSLREKEIYRMPSVASMLVALQSRSLFEAGIRAAQFPLIDPVDAFYLLNPSGDLNRTQAEFEEWFKLQNMQGKAGVAPSTEELTAALEAHEMFLYFGHGSGAQYIPPDKIQKLENCAATLLMGCSSGSLNLSPHYAPIGTSLSYMLAGAPIVVANLWEVTDLDIDRFAKAVLKSFMDERSMSSTGCIQCSILAEEFKSMSVNEKKGNTKTGQRIKKKNNHVDDDDISSQYCFRHKLRAGYFISQARKSCKLKYLIGAAPVCYGVPTGIRKKKDM